MDKEIIVRLHSSFENIVRKHADSGVEYWCARNLQFLLGYAQWKNFAKVIDKAITSCENAGYDAKDHFAGISKMVDLGSGAKREVVRWKSEIPNLQTPIRNPCILTPPAHPLS